MNKKINKAPKPVVDISKLDEKIQRLQGEIEGIEKTIPKVKKKAVTVNSAGSAVVAAPVAPVKKVSEEEIKAIEQLAVRSSWDAWFEVYGTIRDANGNWRGRGQKEQLTANYLQARISEIVTWLQKNKQPVRLLILKPRQRGCSTFSTAGLYNELNKRTINGVIIGAKQDQAKNLFGMVKQYSNGDQFDWGTKRIVNAEDAKFDFGDNKASTCSILGAKDYDPGRSGTYQFVLATEVARWQGEGVANAADVLSGLLKCVQLMDGTTIIMETTAQDAQGDFYERWTKTALEFEEYQAGFRSGRMVFGSYIRVFAPWYKFPDLSLSLTPEQKDHVVWTLDKVERYSSPDFGNESAIRDRFGLTVEQIAWRRKAIDEECKRDSRVFEQDYPSTWETAFLVSGNRRFSSAGLRYLKRIADTAEYSWGVLDVHSVERRRVSWVSTDEGEGMIKRWEEPREGGRYLIACDVMTGADQTQGKDPDKHSVFVIKAGRFVNGRGWERPKTVARIKTPCRWEVDLLAEWVRRLHHYYSGALICPEMNNPGLALLQCLKPWGLPIYQRQVFDEFEQRFENKVGWQTTSKTKPLIIAGLSSALRDFDVEGSGFDILCPDAVDELNSFVRKGNGSEEAMGGKHDDDVMCLAIGYGLLEGAVEYRRVVENYSIPRDLRDLGSFRDTRRSQWG